MTPEPSRQQAVRDAIVALAAACATAGLRLDERRAIDYGEQVTFSAGDAHGTVNVYGGKKGVSFVVGGVPRSPVRQRLDGIVKQHLARQAGSPYVEAGAVQRRVAGRGNEDRIAQRLAAVAGPWIGSDESGKGDYFGPLVAAAVYVAPEQEPALRRAGVRDSKLLSDAGAHKVASEVRGLCAGRFAEELIAPAEYNLLYADARARNENLNDLLAAAHARVIEAVLTNPAVPAEPVAAVIADQFADERYVRERLQRSLEERGRALPLLLQVPRAEVNVAVAAASVLARDRFLGWLEEASRGYAIALPKGGANAAVVAAGRRVVERFGERELANAAKLHFVTTARILR